MSARRRAPRISAWQRSERTPAAAPGAATTLL